MERHGWHRTENKNRGHGQHTEHVVTELGKLQAQAAELLLGLGAERVAAGGPERSDGGADRRVLLGRELVNVAGVGDLALGRRVDAVDLARRQALEVGKAELLGERVHLGVLEELVARHVDVGNRGVLLERALARHLLGEVIARVEELEEAADGVNVLAGKLDLAGLLAC